MSAVAGIAAISRLIASLGILFPASAALLALTSNGQQDPIFSEAQAYERFMGRWSRQLAPALVTFAGVRDGETLLDIGAGTGALAAALATTAPSSRIVGIDPSAPYVELARARLQGERFQLEVGDAQQMRFEDGSFDRVLSLLVVNFIPDPVKALEEMRRVTRRSGTVAAAVWDYGDGMQMLRTFWDEAVALNRAAEPRDERHMPLCRAGELGAMWRKQGLAQVVEEGLTIETRFTGFDDYWGPFLDKQGPAGAYAASLTVTERNLLRERLRRRLLGDGPDRAIALRARAWAVRGVVP
jgi:SAM-dependent methyltransferase